jgi:BarA-like signal transduction histidine kinase
MSGVARLLDSLAREIRDNDTLGHDVVSAASEMAGHVLAYLPPLEKRR